MLVKRLHKNEKINLDSTSTKVIGDMTKEMGEARLSELAKELEDLQELLYAAGDQALLVVLQGRDTSGKDGALEAVAGAMNPVGTRVASFKVPSPLETRHDFLWRVHQQVPEKGQVVFFNRSHYEDVLVARVHNLVPKDIWERRYEHINQFEALLHDSGVIIVKFYLHISRDEQKERLLAREANPAKAWKLNPGDWAERELWDDYTKAYEEALGRCAAENAPWFVVPADHKWFRNVVIAEALVETLRPYAKSWEKKLAQIGETQKAALAAMRTEEKSKND
ncbi:MAG: PPK2 family polyphosphate kinase [Armatimonadota bacterium]